MTIAPLPCRFSTREPSLDDIGVVLDLIAASELAVTGESEVDAEDIASDWRRPGYDVASDGVFVTDDKGACVAYAEVFASRAEIAVLPGVSDQGIGSWLAEWVERRALQQGAAHVRQVVSVNDTHKLEMLSEVGYERTDAAWILEAELDQLEPRLQLPSMFTVRDFVQGQDDRSVWQVIEDAFSVWPNRVAIPIDSWRSSALDRPGFEPWMLPVLVDNDTGDVVGAVCCIDLESDSEVWVDQIAIRPDHQRRGLGGALLLEAFARFAAAGRTRGGLSTSSRTGALGLYERVGMRIKHEFAGLELQLDD